MTQILNRFTGNVITEGEMNLRELVLHYVKMERAAGRTPALRGAYLQGADLRGADLRGADLRGADLRDADLQGADLRGADLQGAYLRGADLRDADLQGAYLQGLKISKAVVFTGLYKYIVMLVIAEDGTEYIRMGCYLRKVTEWESDFWNNPGEFPNDGDMPSKLRWMAYQTALAWLELNREQKE